MWPYYIVLTILFSFHLCRCVKVLFEYNVTLSCKGINDDTPLHIACRLGYTEIAKYLLSQGASTEVW